MSEFKVETSGLSRRSLLRNAACVAGAVPLLLITANSAQAAKLSKAAVAYQDSPKGNRNCANCKLFQPPSSCRSVEGPVSANGWCNIWVKK
ncbi:MAG: high-potential iron-sulfur protein [Rhodomicrobiaceae bacterium]